MGRGVLVNFRGSCLLFPIVCRILDDGKAYTIISSVPKIILKDVNGITQDTPKA